MGPVAFLASRDRQGVGYVSRSLVAAAREQCYSLNRFGYEAAVTNKRPGAERDTVPFGPRRCSRDAGQSLIGFLSVTVEVCTALIFIFTSTFIPLADMVTAPLMSMFSLVSTRRPALVSN